MGIVVGLDGCPTGWIAAVVRDGSLVAVEYHESALAALRAYPEAEAHAFDIPIGLSPDGKRKADVQAREFLGERANSVFWAPLRAVVDVDAASYATFREAYAEGRRVSSGASGGRQSVSSQSFTLVPKIREVGVVATDARVFEVHPEVSFAALSDGQPVALEEDVGRAHAAARLAPLVRTTNLRLLGCGELPRSRGRRCGCGRLRLDGPSASPAARRARCPIRQSASLVATAPSGTDYDTVRNPCPRPVRSIPISSAPARPVGRSPSPHEPRMHSAGADY